MSMDPCPEVRRPNGTLRAFVEARQLVPDTILPILNRAEALANGAPPVPVAPASSATLLFQQPSTRTYLSFAHAAGALGYHTADLRDMSTTSFEKGESLEDGLRTIAELSELVILRQPDHDALLEFVRSSAALPRPPIVVNAGSGPSEHPTQSLIDVAALHRRGILDPSGGPKNIVFVGDLQRSRTVNSLLDVLLGWRHLTFVFVPIAGLGPSSCRLQALQAMGRTFEIRNDLDEALANADAVYLQRLQDEYGGGDAQKHEQELESLRLTPERMARLPEHAVVLHPLPRRREIDPTTDHDPRAGWWETVRHGRFVRTALLEALQPESPS